MIDINKKPIAWLVQALNAKVDSLAGQAGLDPNPFKVGMISKEGATPEKVKCLREQAKDLHETDNCVLLMLIKEQINKTAGTAQKAVKKAAVALPEAKLERYFGLYKKNPAKAKEKCSFDENELSAIKALLHTVKNEEEKAALDALFEDSLASAPSDPEPTEEQSEKKPDDTLAAEYFEPEEEDLSAEDFDLVDEDPEEDPEPEEKPKKKKMLPAL